MCGRFVSSSPPEELARYFGAAPPEGTAAGAGAATAAVPRPAAPGPAPAAPARPGPVGAGPARAGGARPFEPNYNVAPATDILVVYHDRDVRRLDALHWGLVPTWARDRSAGYKMINARAENVARSAAFRRSFTRRRCIIPADGFYEWAKVPGHRTKQPYYVHRVDDEPLAFAGLWEVWLPPEAEGDGTGDGDPAERRWVRSCSIITTAANATMATVHDRMPAILPPSAWDAWLDPENHDTEALGRLLVPAPDGLLTLHPVSVEVNNVRNTGPDLIREVETTGPDGEAAPADRPAAGDGEQGSLLDLDR